MASGSNPNPFVYSHTLEQWEDGWRVLSWLLFAALILATPAILRLCERHDARLLMSPRRWFAYDERLQVVSVIAVLGLFLIAAPVPAMLHAMATVSPVVTTFGIVDPAYETPDCLGVLISAPDYPTQPFCLGATARGLGLSRSGYRLELRGDQSIFGLAVTSYEFVRSVDIPAIAP